MFVRNEYECRLAILNELFYHSANFSLRDDVDNNGATTLAHISLICFKMHIGMIYKVPDSFLGYA